MRNIVGAAILVAVIIAASALDANASPVDSVNIEGEILTKVTSDWLAKTKAAKAADFDYLTRLNDANGFPEGTLQTMFVAESMAGELNIKNHKGYDGYFQLGPYEIKRWCGGGNPRVLKDAAECTVRLLRDYHEMSQKYLKRPVTWADRSRTDWYFLHQQGFRGSSQQYNVAAGYNGTLGNDLIVNLRGNVPQSVKTQLFDGKKLNPKFSHRDLVVVFYRVWDKELERVWKGVR